MKRTVALAVLVLTCGVARADLRVAFDNDFFAHFDPHDDDGFTNDLDIRFWRPRGDYLIGGRLFDRWVTEEPRVLGGRRDLVELVATGERLWGGPAQLTHLIVDARVGPTFTGNLGGRWMQNAFHTLCHCGAPLDEGLQNRYDGGRDAGVLAGGTTRGSIGVPWVHGYSVVDAQAAVGTGVTFVDAAAGGDAIGRWSDTEVGVHLELAVMRFHVVDGTDGTGLAMPGGYRPGWQTGYRIGGYVAHGRYRIEYEFHSNEGGSGSPMGLVALTFKQAGTSF